MYCSSQHVLHCVIEIILKLCCFSLICNVILQLPTYAYILLTPLLLWHVNLHSEIIDLTFRAIQECRAMKSLKLFTKLKYCAAKPTEDWWTGIQRKICLPIALTLDAATGAAFTESWYCNGHWWLKIEVVSKQMEVKSHCLNHFHYLKWHRKTLCAGIACKYVAE